MAARKRKETETFEQYRFNLKNESFAQKHKLKPKVFWDSVRNGTFKK
jgi:hypothetical protein